MDDRTRKVRHRIGGEEMERRREALRRVDANSRIEGLSHTIETDSIYEAFVRGEIEFHEILPRVRAIHRR